MGPLLCLLSAAGFGAMAIFGKLAYDAGVEVGDLLLVRFALAAALLLAVAAATGALRGLPRRSVLAGLGMGAIGYATQSGLYFDALERMDASLLALILYVYPALVLIGAVALGRERASVRRVAALLIALAGTALVLAGAASGSLDALGTAMGFGAALAYTVYILTGDRSAPRCRRWRWRRWCAWARRARSRWRPSCAAARSSDSAPTAGHGWARSPS